MLALTDHATQAMEGARIFVEAPVAEYLDDKLLDARIVDEQVSFTIGEQEQ